MRPEIQYRVGRWGLQQVSGATTGSVFNMERLLYRLDASYSHTDGWRQTGSNRFTIAPELTWLLAPNMRVTAIQTITRDRFTLDARVSGGFACPSRRVSLRPEIESSWRFRSFARLAK
jgi:hypothetical protein